MLMKSSTQSLTEHYGARLLYAPGEMRTVAR